MNIPINETAFLHYLVKEIEDTSFWGRTIGLTEFPNLYEESKSGYDAKIQKLGRPLFIQTKIPEAITNANGKRWKSFKSLYFQFFPYPDDKSHQHNILVSLGKQFKNQVFYAGPLFSNESDFETFVLSKKLIVNSKFINTRNLKTISGSDRHCICYAKNKKTKMWSEEITLEDNDNTPFKTLFQNSEIISIKNLNNRVDEIVKKFSRDFERNESSFDILSKMGIICLFFILE